MVIFQKLKGFSEELYENWEQRFFFLPDVPHVSVVYHFSNGLSFFLKIVC